MATDRYLIGPGLKNKLGDVIRVVDSLEAPGGVASPLSLRFEEPLRASSRTSDVFKTCYFSGEWSIYEQKVVTSLATGETLNAKNLIFQTIPNAGRTLNCVIGKEGTAWYLSNAEHQTTNALTRVAIEGGSLVFNVSAVQLIGSTTSSTTFALDVCETYTNTATTTTSSGQAASFSATSFFYG